MRGPRRRRPDHADHLVERAGARGVEHVFEQRPAVVRKQLLGGAEALRSAGGEDETGYERHGPIMAPGGAWEITVV